jgi:Holliday junction resolvase
VPGRGIRREHQVIDLLKADGWVCLRAAGSLGPIDIAAVKRGMPPRFVQVKSDRTTPYKNFGPDDRRRLIETAHAAGAEAWLAWWPPGKPLIWISQDAWPNTPT